jgi:type I restriction-modification system DNA methylase subunit
MSEEQRRQLQQQLWNIANTLRGKMGADEFRDFHVLNSRSNALLFTRLSD